jgi:actin-like ATPase involved in cell morphogenesis
MSEADIAAVQTWIRERYGLEIGLRTAEEVAIVARAPGRPGEPETFTIRGGDATKRETRTVEVDLREARWAIRETSDE